MIEILETPAVTPSDQRKGGAQSGVGEEEEKSYGFVDKIIDGISFSLNSLHVQLRAPKFTASLDLSFLKANPSPPNFKPFPQKKQDLRLSRVKCHPFVLLFRTISWQTLKIEAKARNPDDPHVDEDDEEECYRKSSSDVIRLISSGGSANMTVKKSLLNREVVCVKMAFNMEDILWLLTATSSQSRDAMTLINSLSELVVSQSSTGHSAAASAPSLPSNPATRSPSKTTSAAAVRMDTSSQLYRIFSQFAPVESSIHFNLKTFQLQIVDDMNTTNGSFHSLFPPLASGSALLFSATNLTLSLYPEYNPRRGFKQGFNEKDTSLHVTIRVSTMQLHCVGLNDSRLRSRKKNDDEKNKYFVSAPVGVPDVIPAVEVSLNHYYETEGSERTDWIHVKMGPTRVYLDEPTILWIHSFVLPLIIAGSSGEKNGPESFDVKPHVETQIELTMPVLVMDQRNPFEIFPSPFSAARTAVHPASESVTSPADTQLEVSCTKVFVQRLKGTDMAWAFRVDPLWVDLVKDSPALHRKDRRIELVAPFSVRGTVIVFPKTEFSVEEVRIAIDVPQTIKVGAMLSDLPDLLKILSKMDIFADFIAQDKMEMRRCFAHVDDSLFSVRVKLQDVAVELLRLRVVDAPKSSNGSDTPSDLQAQIPRSASAPDDFSGVVDEPQVAQDPLSAASLMENFSMTVTDSMTGSTMAADVVSLDSRISDDDDQYILKHMQVPVSMSSSPSLLQVNDERRAESSTPTDSVEEAEDVSAMLSADFEDGDMGQRVDKEVIAALSLQDLQLEKRATDLHGVTVITIKKPIKLTEPLMHESQSLNNCDPVDQKNESQESRLMIRSEIQWSEEEGKQEMMSVLLQDHPPFRIHAKTMDAIVKSATEAAADKNAIQENDLFVQKTETSPLLETPAVSVFLQKFACSVLHDECHEPTFSLVFDAGLVHKDTRNVLSVHPLAASSSLTARTPCDMLQELEKNHADMFGSCPLVSGFTDAFVAEKMLDTRLDDDVMGQVLSRNEQLEKRVQELEQENRILRLRSDGASESLVATVNHESD